MCMCGHHCISALTSSLFSQTRKVNSKGMINVPSKSKCLRASIGEPERVCLCDKGGWLRRKFQCESLSQSNDVFHVFMAWGAPQYLHRKDFYPTVKHLRAPAESRELKRNHKRPCCIRLSCPRTWIEITFQTQFLTRYMMWPWGR